MKVRIVKGSIGDWHKSYIGKEFEIKNENEKYYYVHKDIYPILKSDCEIVEETGSFEVSGEFFPRGAKNMVTPEQVSDEKRGCETCKYDLGGQWCAKHPCHNESNWQPKDPDGYFGYASDHVPDVKKKPKKLKYVCTACVGTKCIKKTIGVLPTNCKYPQANWKLKEVK